MRTLILSDLHANAPATEAVLADARHRGFDRAVCLGDLVGYGASPNEVVDMVRDLAPDAQVRGNHDKAACGISEPDTFNSAARKAIHWTRGVLSASSRAYLADLPAGPLVFDDLVLSHGSPLDEEEYIMGEPDAAEVMEATPDFLGLFGHTHLAILFSGEGGREPSGFLLARGGIVPIVSGIRYLFNPGSIGQPRDRDPRASYALYDAAAGTLEVVRVSYDVRAARQAIIKAGLPRDLERRLARGL